MHNQHFKKSVNFVPSPVDGSEKNNDFMKEQDQQLTDLFARDEQ
jgi:hypothetical protein